MEAEAVLNLQNIIIEPLDPGNTIERLFSCGVGRLDNFLKRTARKQQAGDLPRIWFATESGQTGIVGYCALSAHFIEGDDLQGTAHQVGEEFLTVRHGGEQRLQQTFQIAEFTVNRLLSLPPYRQQSSACLPGET